MSASRGLTVEITGLDELRRRLDPEIFGPAITAALTEAANLVKPEIERGAPRFSGRLARSVRITMDTRSGGSPKFARIAPRASHAIIVEKGSRPHWRLGRGPRFMKKSKEQTQNVVESIRTVTSDK